MPRKLLIGLLLLSANSYCQSKFESKSKIYSFIMPNDYTNQPSNQVRNKFIFINKSDTTSLVVNVNEKPFDQDGLKSFKQASNSDVEKNYFAVLQNPKIIARGELDSYKDKTIFFHVRHETVSPLENDLMLTYLFYNKGKR